MNALPACHKQTSYKLTSEETEASPGSGIIMVVNRPVGSGIEFGSCTKIISALNLSLSLQPAVPCNISPEAEK